MARVFCSPFLGRVAIVVACGAQTAFAAATDHGHAPMCQAERGVFRGPSSEAALRTRQRTVLYHLDGEMAVDRLKNPAIEVKSLDDLRETDPWQEPSPKLRDRLFAEAGLESFVRRWRHFDRDMLFLRAQEYGLTRLAHKYPAIPSHRLSTLQRLIAGEKAGGR